MKKIYKTFLMLPLIAIAGAIIGTGIRKKQTHEANGNKGGKATNTKTRGRVEKTLNNYHIDDV